MGIAPPLIIRNQISQTDQFSYPYTDFYPLEKSLKGLLLSCGCPSVRPYKNLRARLMSLKSMICRKLCPKICKFRDLLQNVVKCCKCCDLSKFYKMRSPARRDLVFFSLHFVFFSLFLSFCLLKKDEIRRSEVWDLTPRTPKIH